MIFPSSTNDFMSALLKLTFIEVSVLQCFAAVQWREPDVISYEFNQWSNFQENTHVYIINIFVILVLIY